MPLNYPKPKGPTENPVMSPFSVEEAADLKLGDLIVRGVEDEKCRLVKKKITDEKGGPVKGSVINVWMRRDTHRILPMRVELNCDFYFKASYRVLILARTTPTSPSFALWAAFV